MRLSQENDSILSKIMEQAERTATLEEHAKNSDEALKILSGSIKAVTERLGQIEKKLTLATGFIIAVQILFPFAVPQLLKVYGGVTAYLGHIFYG